MLPFFCLWAEPSLRTPKFIQSVSTRISQSCHSYSDNSSIRCHTAVGKTDFPPLPYKLSPKIKSNAIHKNCTNYLQKKYRHFCFYLISDILSATALTKPPISLNQQVILLVQSQSTPAQKYCQ